MPNTCLIIYRGPLERPRIAYLIESVQVNYQKIAFVWIYPQPMKEDHRKHIFEIFFNNYPEIEVTIIDKGWKKTLEIVQIIKQKFRKITYDLVATMGFSAHMFSRFVDGKKYYWFINGIPEEKLATKNSFKNKQIVAALWNVQSKFGKKPDKIIAVSKRMSKIIADRKITETILHAPLCVDIENYTPKETKPRKYFIYSGYGAPWQALDLLSLVWQEIHKQDAAILFRVISFDERTKILAENIASNNIFFVGTSNYNEVANYLSEGICGFLIRRDDIVNQVSFPTKFAEYLASGNWVVTSNINWDIKDYMQQFKAGVLVNPADDAKIIAKQVLDYYYSTKDTFNTNTYACAAELDRNKWIDYLGKNL